MTSPGSGQPINAEEFESLFREYFYALVSFARRILSDTEASRDVVHNVFMNLWENRESVHTETSLKSWLFTSVKNRSLNYLRDHKKFISQEEAGMQIDENYGTADQDHTETAEVEGRIRTALDKLPDACRKIFMMTRFDGLKYREVAEKLGIAQKTVETQMSRALKILREQLKDILPVLLIIVIRYLIKL